MMMRSLFAAAAFALAACAASADAGDPPMTMSALTPAPVGCVPSADATVWLPAPGEAVRLAAASGYGKSCDGVRDDRWVAEVVNAHGAAFRAQAQPADGGKSHVSMTVYGWVPPRWLRHVYQDGHWQVLAEADGSGMAAAQIDPADDVVPYATVRVAARGADGRSLALSISR
jgi:hypothetical protein